MLVGTYEHNIDGKNRLFVPSKFRAELGSEFIYKVFRSKYPSIQLYRKEDFERELIESTKDIRDEQKKRRAMAKKCLGTGEAVCDNQGRIVLNMSLAKDVKIEKECILSGFGTYVEIMSREVYDAFSASLTEEAVRQEESFESEEKLRCEKRAEGAYLDLPDSEL